VAQSPRTINGILLMTSFIPAIGAVIAIIALFFYDLDDRKVEVMCEELKARRAAQNEAILDGGRPLAHDAT